MTGVGLTSFPHAGLSISKSGHKRDTMKKLFVILLVLFVLFGQALAGSLSLAWDHTGTQPDGFKLFMRESGRSYNYSTPVWTGTAKTCTITNLAGGETYFFVVRAFLGTESSVNSNEVTFTTTLPGKPSGIGLSDQ